MSVKGKLETKIMILPREIMYVKNCVNSVCRSYLIICTMKFIIELLVIYIAWPSLPAYALPSHSLHRDSSFTSGDPNQSDCHYEDTLEAQLILSVPLCRESTTFYVDFTA